jgi:hypothetical protein
VAGERIRVPILMRPFEGREVHEVEFILAVRMTEDTFVPLPFRFDSGTDLTMIPIPLARSLGIPFTRGRSTTVQGATGHSRGFLAPLWFYFPQLPQWQFETLACFTPPPASPWTAVPVRPGPTLLPVHNQAQQPVPEWRFRFAPQGLPRRPNPAG